MNTMTEAADFFLNDLLHMIVKMIRYLSLEDIPKILYRCTQHSTGNTLVSRRVGEAPARTGLTALRFCTRSSWRRSWMPIWRFSCRI